MSTEWLKDVGPSTELRKWFGHDPQKWDTFRRRYARELDTRREAWQPIVSAARRGRVTLIYSSHDTVHNNAVALQQYLRSKMRSRPLRRPTAVRDADRVDDARTDSAAILRSTRTAVPPRPYGMGVATSPAEYGRPLGRRHLPSHRGSESTRHGDRRSAEGVPAAPRLVVTVTPAPRSEADERRLRKLLDRLLGLRIDLSAWYRTANRDPRLRRLAARFRGVKPPRFPTIFEALVNAFACQQFSLEAGLTSLTGSQRRAARRLKHGECRSRLSCARTDDPDAAGRIARDRFQRAESARALLDLAGAIARRNWTSSRWQGNLMT